MSKRKRLNKLRLVIFIFLLLLVIAIGAGCGILASMVRNLPSWKPGDLISEATSFVYDYKGNYIGKLHEVEDRIPIEYKDIPKNLENAFLAIEDIDFYKHHGISIRGLIRAGYVDIIKGERVQGASTITQQLVRNAILENREKSFKRKIQEALLAIQIERKYTKKEILTFYLNEVYFGHGAYGVQAASQVYFGKDVKNLTLAECAMLAGLVKNPSGKYSPYLNPQNAKGRRQVVLSNMLKYGFINQKEYDQAINEPFKLVGLQQRHHVNYPWFMDYVIDQAEKTLSDHGFDTNLLYTGGLKIYTTLNPKIQSAAEKAFSNDANFPKSRTASQVQGAMVVMEPNTGAIRAIVGGREYLTKRGLNRATQMRRQPGSVIKPLVDYAPALELGYSPATVLDDVSTSFGSGDNAYSPENYDGRYRGLISMRVAIRDSVNIPAVKMLNQIGVDTGYKFARKLGLPVIDKDKNLALALGGVSTGFTPLEIASAYSAFANNGVKVQPIVISKITDRKGNVLIDNIPKKERVMSSETAYLMTDMLRTVVNAGTGFRANIPWRQVAGKTGTTQLDPNKFKDIKGNRDAWFAGYTPELVAVVWEGYDTDVDKNGKPQYQYKTYGGNYPAKIFHDVMITALQDYPAKSFTRPSDIVYLSVDAKSGLLPSKYTPANFITNEIFSKQNLPSKVSDIWVPAIVDPETNQLATNACPQRISRVFLQRKEHWYGRAPEDAYLELPRAYCKLHPGDPATSITQNGLPGTGGQQNEQAPNTGPSDQIPQEQVPPTSGENISGNNDNSNLSPNTNPENNNSTVNSTY